MKIFRPFLVFALVILLAFPVYGEESAKIFQLKDGSKIKGQLVGVENDVYKIQTLHMGLIQVRGSEIIQISAASESPSTASANPETTSSTPSEQLKTQANQLQQQFLTDPAVMADIQAIVEDPEVASILSDPQFVNDMLSYDPNRIQGNPKTQAMMQNPKIQQLMNKIQAKVQSQEK